MKWKYCDRLTIDFLFKFTDEGYSPHNLSSTVHPLLVNSLLSQSATSHWWDKGEMWWATGQTSTCRQLTGTNSPALWPPPKTPLKLSLSVPSTTKRNFPPLRPSLSIPLHSPLLTVISAKSGCFWPWGQTKTDPTISKRFSIPYLLWTKVSFIINQEFNI